MSLRLEHETKKQKAEQQYLQDSQDRCELEMTRFKVTYRRLKPAGSIEFDPNLEFVDTIELPATTPEEALRT